MRGQAHLLDDLKVIEDLERVRLLFDDLESRRDVIDLLGRAERAEGVRIFIGSENKLFSMSGSSTIIAPYHDRAGRIVGVHRRDRPDAAELCPRHPDGRLHRQGRQQAARPADASFRRLQSGTRDKMIRTEQIDAGRVNGLITHAERPRGGVLLLCRPSPASTPSCASAASVWPRPAIHR